VYLLISACGSLSLRGLEMRHVFLRRTSGTEATVVRGVAMMVRGSCAGLNSPGRQALRKGRCDEHGQPHRRWLRIERRCANTAQHDDLSPHTADSARCVRGTHTRHRHFGSVGCGRSRAASAATRRSVGVTDIAPSSCRRRARTCPPAAAGSTGGTTSPGRCRFRAGVAW
jgi:hypothetical protein